VVETALWTQYFRNVSAAADESAVGQMIGSTQRLALLLVVPIVWIGSAYCEPILQLLYTSDFVEAGALLTLQLSGDILKVILSIFTVGLLARQRPAAYIAFESCWCVLFAGLCYAVVSIAGVHSAGVGYLGASVVTLVLVLVYRRASLPKNFGLVNLMFIGLFVQAVLLLTVIWKLALLRFLVAPALIVLWFRLVLRDDEREMIRQKTEEMKLRITGRATQ
jgi:O-antigen/teichoic acid export membrane protein